MTNVRVELRREETVVLEMEMERRNSSRGMRGRRNKSEARKGGRIGRERKKRDGKR